MYYEEIEGMTLFVCRDVYMLYKIMLSRRSENWMDCESRRSST